MLFSIFCGLRPFSFYVPYRYCTSIVIVVSGTLANGF